MPNVATAGERVTLSPPATTNLLHDHLIHAHGREPHEIRGLPLEPIHHLEHFDDDLGLLRLDHRHTH